MPIRPTHRRYAQVIDAATTAVSLVGAYGIWHWVKDQYPSLPIGTEFVLGPTHVVIAAVVLPLWLITLDAQRAYSHQRFSSVTTELRLVAVTVAVGMSVVLGLLFFLRADYIPRSLIVGFAAINLSLLAAVRVARHAAARARHSEPVSVLVVGAGPEASQFLQLMQQQFHRSLRVVGVLTANEAANGADLGVPVLGSVDRLAEVLKSANPEEVIVALSPWDIGCTKQVLEECARAGVTVRLPWGFFGSAAKHLELDRILDLEILSFVFTTQTEWQLVFKRAFDIVVSLVALVVLAPVLVTIALLIWWQSGTPILYEWNVVGLNRRPIRSWKFRTMVNNADLLKKQLAAQNEMTGPVFKITNDPRITPLGKFLRKYSLDELPQLVSVLKGDLSVVGPRPPLQTEFNEFDLWHRRKLTVKPGLTCLWQISGRSEIRSFDEWVRLDLEYIDTWSLWLDLKILIKTIPVVVLGTGAK